MDETSIRTRWQHFYGTGFWQRRRALQLKLEPLCRMCLAKGLITPARVADHIEPHNVCSCCPIIALHELWRQCTQLPAYRSADAGHSLSHSEWSVSTNLWYAICAAENLEIPGSPRSLSSGRASRGRSPNDRKSVRTGSKAKAGRDSVAANGAIADPSSKFRPDLPDERAPEKTCQAPSAKKFLFTEIRICSMNTLSRLGAKGRIAVVTRREAGMRWTRRCLLTSGTDADGEVVWSWRPERSGAKLPTMLAHRGLRRWQTEGFTEESAYKP